jgi:hypothetical protein
LPDHLSCMLHIICNQLWHDQNVYPSNTWPELKIGHSVSNHKHLISRNVLVMNPVWSKICQLYTLCINYNLFMILQTRYRCS